MTIQILIADDHSIVRSGLKQLFTFDPDIDVAGEAANGTMILELLAQREFDVLLLDLNMPGINGGDLINRIREDYPSQRILVYTMHNEPQIAKRIIRAGAKGFISKDSEPEKLLDAIHLVASGKNYLDAGIAQELAFEAATADSRQRHTILSDREYEVFIKLAKGMSVNEIAHALILSNKTVSSHKQRMMEKMNFASITDLVRYAVEFELIS